MAVYQHIDNGFEPVFDANSLVLILGSFPSVLSRKQAFYYGNPHNRFWRVIASCVGEATPPNEGDCDTSGQHIDLARSIENKRMLLLRHQLALWDVIASCDIKGSSDASIQNVVPVDIQKILAVAHLRAIVCNGATSARLYRRWLQPIVGLLAQNVPSTSPANAAWSYERLAQRWKEVLLPLLHDGLII